MDFWFRTMVLVARFYQDESKAACSVLYSFHCSAQKREMSGKQGLIEERKKFLRENPAPLII